MIRHIVMFNTLSTASQEDVTAVLRSAKEDLAGIEGVKNLAVSTSFEVVEPPAYRYAITMEFESDASLQSYMVHPTHDEFRGIFFPIRDDFMIVDLRELPEPI